MVENVVHLMTIPKLECSVVKGNETFSLGKICVFSGVRLDFAMGLADEAWTNPGGANQLFF